MMVKQKQQPELWQIFVTSKNTLMIFDLRLELCRWLTPAGGAVELWTESAAASWQVVIEFYFKALILQIVLDLILISCVYSFMFCGLS